MDEIAAYLMRGKRKVGRFHRSCFSRSFVVINERASAGNEGME